MSLIGLGSGLGLPRSSTVFWLSFPSMVRRQVGNLGLKHAARNKRIESMGPDVSIGEFAGSLVRCFVTYGNRLN
jgi:hypothetical protein